MVDTPSEIIDTFSDKALLILNPNNGTTIMNITTLTTTFKYILEILIVDSISLASLATQIGMKISYVLQNEGIYIL